MYKFYCLLPTESFVAILQYIDSFHTDFWFIATYLTALFGVSVTSDNKFSLPWMLYSSWLVYTYTSDQLWDYNNFAMKCYGVIFALPVDLKLHFTWSASL